MYNIISECDFETCFPFIFNFSMCQKPTKDRRINCVQHSNIKMQQKQIEFAERVLQTKNITLHRTKNALHPTHSTSYLTKQKTASLIVSCSTHKSRPQHDLTGSLAPWRQKNKQRKKTFFLSGCGMTQRDRSVRLFAIMQT